MASAFICTADLPSNCSTGQRSNKKNKVLAAHAGASLFHVTSSREPCLDFSCRDTNCSYTLVAKGTTPPLVGQAALQESQLHNYEKGLCYFSSRFVSGLGGMLPMLSPGSAGCEQWKISGIEQKESVHYSGPCFKSVQPAALSAFGIREDLSAHYSTGHASASLTT